MSLPDHCDPVMLDLFRAELDTHLPALNQGILLVEKGHAGEKDLEAMMSAAHSIKGAARIVGIDDAVRVAHAMEDCFSAAQKQDLTLSSDSVDILLQGTDALQRICAPQSDSPVTSEWVEALLGQLALIRENKIPPSVDGSTPAPQFSTETVQWVAPGANPAERCIILPGAIDDGAA